MEGCLENVLMPQKSKPTFFRLRCRNVHWSWGRRGICSWLDRLHIRRMKRRTEIRSGSGPSIQKCIPESQQWLFSGVEVPMDSVRSIMMIMMRSDETTDRNVIWFGIFSKYQIFRMLNYVLARYTLTHKRKNNWTLHGAACDRKLHPSILQKRASHNIATF